MLLAVLADDAAPPARGLRVAQLAADFAERPGTVLLLAAALAALAVTPLAGPRTLAPSTAGESVVKEVAYGAGGRAGRRGRPGRRARHPDGAGAGLPAGPVVRAGGLRRLPLAPAGARRRDELLGVPLFGGDVLPVAALTVAGSLRLAALSWTLVERPLLDRLSRPVSSHRDRPATGR